MYKVVRKIDGKLCSVCASSDFLEEARVEYIPNETVYPKFKNTKLFVFKKLKDARYFAEDFRDPDLEIWECEVENATSPGYFFIRMNNDFIANFAELISNGKLGNIGYAPTGTRVVDSVKLTRKVTDEELGTV